MITLPGDPIHAPRAAMRLERSETHRTVAGCDARPLDRGLPGRSAGGTLATWLIAGSALWACCALAQALPPLPKADGAAASMPKGLPHPQVNTAAPLPAGRYALRITLKQRTIVEPVDIARDGPVLRATVRGGDVLEGTLSSSGQLSLSGGKAAQKIQLTAQVQNQSAAGSVRLGRGSSSAVGEFLLQPAAEASAKPMVDGPPDEDCDFWCQLDRLIDCLFHPLNCRFKA